MFADTFTVLVSGDETAGQFGIFTALCPTGDIIPTHAHSDTHETFYIVEGRVRLFVQLADGEKVSRLLGQGDFGFVPAGAPHAYRVEAAGPDGRCRDRRVRTVLPGDGYAGRHDQPSSPPYIPEFPQMGAAAAGPPHGVPAGLRLAGGLSAMSRPSRCRAGARRSPARRPGSGPVAYGSCTGVPTPTCRACGRWNSTSICRGAVTPAPVVVFLHGGGWRLAATLLGPAYTGTVPTPFERFAAAGSRWPPSIGSAANHRAGPAARRQGGRALAARPRRRTGPRPRPGSRHGVSPQAVTSPRCSV